jgi:RHS repeat-associated protein
MALSCRNSTLNMAKRRFAIGLLSALAVGVFARGQITNVTGATSTPTAGVGHDYLKLLSETVDPSSGGVSVRVSIPIPPSRAFTLPFAFSYDSNSAALQLSAPGVIVWGYNQNVFAEGYWSNTLPQLSAVLEQYALPNTFPANPCYASTGYVFQDPTGGRHALGVSAILSNTSQFNPPPCSTAGWHNYFTGGDDFLQATIIGISPTSGAGGSTGFPGDSGPGAGEVRVADANGTVYDFANSAFPGTWNCNTGPLMNNVVSYALPTTIEDRNGNILKFSSACINTTINISDTTGRTAISIQSPNITKITQVSVAGLTNPYALTWGTVSSTNPSLNPTPILGTQVGPGCSNVPLWNHGNAIGNAITMMTLPNGQKYQFGYDPTYGLLDKITYPDGGYVSYTWGVDSQSAEVSFTNGSGSSGACQFIYDKPAILHRYVSFDGSTVAFQQDFLYATVWTGQLWSSKTTTVVTHDLIRGTSFQTIYTYAPILSTQIPNSTTPSAPENFADRQIPVEQTVVYDDTSGKTLKTVGKYWLDPYELGCETETLDDGSVSGTYYSYGPGRTITDKKEYDFGILKVPCSNYLAPANPTRETVTTYQTFASTPIFQVVPSILAAPATALIYGNGTLASQTNYSYDQTAAAAVANLPTGTHDETNYGSASSSARANATTVTKRCFPNCSDATTTYTYDETGQNLSTVDPVGNGAGGVPSQHTTAYSYADNYDSPPSADTNSFLTKITRPATSGINHIESFKYAYADGQLISSTDENGLIMNYSYNDSLRRLTETDRPDGGKTTLSYNDAPPVPSVIASKTINTTQTLTSVAARDGMGHQTQTQLTSDPQGTVYTTTTYDGLGRAYTISNPYRSGSDPTTSAGTTTYGYDALSRKISEAYADGSVLQSAYCGSTTLVTDPVSKWRRSRVDGLGRMVEVDEPNVVGATVASTGCPAKNDPIWVTTYTYDALNDLTQVLQNGSHQRTGTYDSLSRLQSSSNPETGTITYTYDPNGNVLTRKDARSIITTNTYDALNRLATSTYSNGDSTVTNAYDQPACLGLSTCQNIGHRTNVTDAAGSDSWSFEVDKTNSRSVHQEQRTIISSPTNITKVSQYYLDLAGNVTQQIYPTGRIVNFTYDSASRPSTATDGSSGITYASAAQTPPTGCLAKGTCYTPQGSIYSVSLGQSSSFTGFNATETFNKRLQPNEIKALSSTGTAIDISYNFVDPVTAKNAGHVYSITNNLDNTRSQTFTYDQVNRILSAGTTSISGQKCWGYQYSYDPWGNLLGQAAWSPTYNGCTELTPAPTPVDANNHVTTLTYDASGDTTNDGAYGYLWNGEGQVTSAGGVNYLYDGDGRRVAKTGSKLYWYGSGSDTIVETDAGGNTLNEYIFFAGKRIGMLPAGSTPLYYAEDLLGSSRVIVQSTGAVCYDADLYPFGGEHAFTNTCAQNNYKFEGKERDPETGNDDFGARYYGDRLGRWLSADWSSAPALVPYANLMNPQTLNLYSMVADDPESFADLDGHDYGGPASLSKVQDNDWFCQGHFGCSEIEFDYAYGLNSLAHDLAENQLGAVTWHWVPDDKEHPDPKKGHWAPDRGDTVCNTQSGKCYRYDGKKWDSLSADESRILIIGRGVVNLANGPINVIIVVAGAEVAAITIVEAAPYVAQAAKNPVVRCIAAKSAGSAADGALGGLAGAVMLNKTDTGSLIKAAAIAATVSTIKDLRKNTAACTSTNK